MHLIHFFLHSGSGSVWFCFILFVVVGLVLDGSGVIARDKIAKSIEGDAGSEFESRMVYFPKSISIKEFTPNKDDGFILCCIIKQVDNVIMIQSLIKLDGLTAIVKGLYPSYRGHSELMNNSIKKRCIADGNYSGGHPSLQMISGGLSYIDSLKQNTIIINEEFLAVCGCKDIRPQLLDHCFVRNPQLRISPIKLGRIETPLLFHLGIHPCESAIGSSLLVFDGNSSKARLPEGEDSNERGGNSGDRSRRWEPLPPMWLIGGSYALVLILGLLWVFFSHTPQKYAINSSNPPNPQFPKDAS